MSKKRDYNLRSKKTNGDDLKTKKNVNWKKEDEESEDPQSLSIDSDEEFTPEEPIAVDNEEGEESLCWTDGSLYFLILFASVVFYMLMRHH